jgi:oligoendopeptidase F
MHELGHNLEQLCSTHFVPRPALRGVPNTACTEAFAFLYQGLASSVLNLPEQDPQAAADMHCCERLLEGAQIAGPALLEILVWRWIYENPDAGAEAVRDTVLRIAESLWSKYYVQYLGQDPYAILGAYQHMVGYPLYLADYALGHIISHQIIRHMHGKDLATETRRICSIGSLTPDAWMKIAVGAGIDAGVLANDAAKAAKRLLAAGASA